VVTSEGSFTKNFVTGNASGSVVGGSKPEAVITIKCGKGAKPEGVSGAYNAQELLKYATGS
jgi:hypothetical protein